MCRDKLRIGIVVFLWIVVIVALGIAIAIHRSTLVEWWKPVAVSLVVTLIASLILWKFRIDKVTLKRMLMPATIFSVTLCGFYVLNYIGTDETESVETFVPIVKKYTEIHSHSRRISRHTVARGREYTVYCVDVQLADGRIKKFHVSREKYQKLHKGEKLRLDIKEGTFGIPVIKNYKNIY